MYWRLVRSAGVGSKVRQQTLAQLGELDARGQIAARHLADSLIGVERQPGLFDDPVPPPKPFTVDSRRFWLQRSRRLGDVWIAWKLWQVLGLDQWLEQRMPAGRGQIPLCGR